MGAEVALGAAVVGSAAQAYGAYKDMGDAKDARREARGARDDLAQRREATYRDSRAKVNSVLESYYAKRGWKMPEQLPGAYTAVGLPGEKPLYQDNAGQPQEDYGAIKESTGVADNSEAMDIVNNASSQQEDSSPEPLYKGPAQAQTQAPADAGAPVGVNARGEIVVPVESKTTARTPIPNSSPVNVPGLRPLVEDEDEAQRIISTLRK